MLQKHTLHSGKYLHLAKDKKKIILHNKNNLKMYQQIHNEMLLFWC